MIYVKQRFHAVGHGTFFTGLIRAYGGRGRKFSWVYDCGSKRTTRIVSSIEALENWHAWPKRIDFFVLSHFDDDHVNGVERFLRNRSVRYLILPYMDIAQRLALSISIASDPCSASTALFQLEPVRWLAGRELSDKVESIVFVQGGKRGDDDLPINEELYPDLERSEARLPFIAGEGDEQFRLDYLTNQDLISESRPDFLLWQHHQPFADAQLKVEFMCFNSEQPNLFHKNSTGERVARRSKAMVEAVRGDINTVIDQYRLADLSKPPRNGWRRSLRQVYEKHFGHSSQARNNISLCLLVRPAPLICGLHFFRPKLLFSIEKAGLLFLGDLKVDCKIIAAMKSHFGLVRWNTISGVQVPHHGSRHSWEIGNAARFSPDYFVQCVPDNCLHHPHHDVVQDLEEYPTLRANYKHAVNLDYYIAWHM